MSGTHDGAFLGIPPSGRAVRVSDTIISRFADSKWAEDWVNYDRLGLLQQISALSAYAPGCVNRRATITRCNSDVPS